jgi:hypothetical protein
MYRIIHLESPLANYDAGTKHCSSDSVSSTRLSSISSIRQTRQSRRAPMKKKPLRCSGLWSGILHSFLSWRCTSCACRRVCGRYQVSSALSASVRLLIWCWRSLICYFSRCTSIFLVLAVHVASCFLWSTSRPTLARLFKVLQLLGLYWLRVSIDCEAYPALPLDDRLLV